MIYTGQEIFISAISFYDRDLEVEVTDLEV